MDNNTSRNVWIVVGIIIVLIIGWFLLRQAPTDTETPGTTGTSTDQTSTGTPSGTTSTTGATTSDYHDNIYLVRTSTSGVAYIADFAGMTLYTYDRDTTGVSNCTTATCTANFRPYSSGATGQGTLPNNIGVITRPDGSKQFTWKGKPLYYYSGDQNPGDMRGDNVDKAWHLIRP